MATSQTSHEDSGRPVLIAKFNAKLELELEQTACEEVFLNSNVINKPVALFSVNGPVRLGKSFMGNCILYEISKTGESDYKFMNPGTMFHSQSGVEKVTHGIWIWSTPIMVEDRNNQQIAMFLIDAEGLLEDGAPEKRDILIFAFISKISSVQLYFFDGRLKASELNYLEYLANSATKLFDGASKSPTFQSMVYLVRNFEGSDKFKCGKDGGKEYLNSFNSTHRLGWNSLKKLYNSIECILLAHPGEGVVGRTFFGYTAVIPTAFIESVQELVDIIKSVGYVRPRTINGRPANGKTVYDDLTKTAAVISSAQLPEPITMMDCMAIRDTTDVRKQCLNLYQNTLKRRLDAHIASGKALSEEFITKTHENTRSESLSVFEDHLRKAKLSDHNGVARMDLQEGIEVVYQCYRDLYLEIKKNRDLQEDLCQNRDAHIKDIMTKDKQMNDARIEAEQRIEALEKENEHLRLQSEGKHTLTQDLEMKMNETSAALQRKERELDESNEKLLHLTQELSREKANSEGKNDEIRKLTGNLDAYKRDLQLITNDRDLLNERVLDLENEMKAVSKELAEEKKSSKNLRSQLEMANNSLEQLNSNFMIKCQDFNELAANAKFTEEKLLAALKKADDEKEKVVADYQKDVKQLQSALNTVQEEKEHVLGDYSRKACDVERDKVTVEERAQNLEKELVDTKRKLIEMEEAIIAEEENKKQGSFLKFSDFQVVLSKEIEFHAELKSGAQRGIEEVLTERNKLAKNIKTFKENVITKELNDKDSQKIWIIITILVGCLSVVLYSTKANEYFWMATSFQTLVLIISLGISFFKRGKSHEEQARKELFLKLEEDGNSILRLERILKDMQRSTDILQRLGCLIKGSALSEECQRLITEGPLNTNKLTSILRVLNESEVLPRNRDKLQYDLNVADSDFGRQPLDDIRSQIRNERKDLEKIYC